MFSIRLVEIVLAGSMLWCVMLEVSVWCRIVLFPVETACRLNHQQGVSLDPSPTSWTSRIVLCNVHVLAIRLQSKLF